MGHKDSRSDQWAKFGRLALPGFLSFRINGDPLKMDMYSPHVLPVVTLG